MKIISLNIAGRANFGRDYQKRMKDIADFISRGNADIVCLQEVTFDDKSSLADKINNMLNKPYDYIYTQMSERYTFDRFSKTAMENWNKGLTEHTGDYLTDGMAFLSKIPVKHYDAIIMTPAPADDRGRPDFRVRVTQNVELESGIKISNVHLATNNNAYQQLSELLNYTNSNIIVGDFNMTRDHLLAHKDIWKNKYQESTDFEDYISFPNDKVAYDHMFLSKNYHFTSIKKVDGLSDHSAMIFEIEKS